MADLHERFKEKRALSASFGTGHGDFYANLTAKMADFSNVARIYDDIRRLISVMRECSDPAEIDEYRAFYQICE